MSIDSKLQSAISPLADRETDAPSPHTSPSFRFAATGNQPNITPDSSFQNYLFGSAGSKGKPAWSDSTQGRAAIRLISRGIFGAAFFTIGGRYARNQLRDYEPHEWDKSKPLQWIAKGFDVTFGKVIGKTASLFANTSEAMTALEREEIRHAAMWKATRFRTKAYYHNAEDKFLQGPGSIRDTLNGRSLGAEMVGMTFDFAMASVGDATMRNVIQAFDPNIKKSWIVNDDGTPAGEGQKGHVDWGKAVKAFGQTAWRIVSKNQGEDWAAALPYVYQMRWQREALARRFPGFKIGSDNQMNGGVLKINEHGQVIGDYQLPGAIDLHARFVGYNWYTLMFREGYDAIGRGLHQWKENAFALPQLPTHFNPIQSTVDGIGSTLRYVTKSFIKANLYMNAAVIPFWLFRTPQTKWRGLYMNPNAEAHENAILSRTPQPLSHFDSNHTPIFTKDTASFKVHPSSGVHFGEGNAAFLGNRPVGNPTHTYGDPYNSKIYEHYPSGFQTTFSKILNPFGKLSYSAGTGATKLSEHLPTGIKNYLGAVPFRQGEVHATARESMVRSFVDASFCYTPYMWAKAETALRVDDTPGNGQLGEMDKAIYGVTDNLAAFKFGAAWQYAKKVATLATHFEKSVVSREGGVEKPPAGDGTAVPYTSTAPLPQSTIQTGHSQHGMLRDPSMRTRANDNEHADNDNEYADRQWAESVAGRNLAGKFQAVPPTRH